VHHFWPRCPAALQNTQQQFDLGLCCVVLCQHVLLATAASILTRDVAYWLLAGTSMAAPLVAGAVGLCLSILKTAPCNLGDVSGANAYASS
jgi:hypothetical protein